MGENNSSNADRLPEVAWVTLVTRASYLPVQPHKTPIEIPTHYSYHAWLSEVLCTHASAGMYSHKLASHANLAAGPS
jgi:hypothetical protein